MSDVVELVEQWLERDRRRSGDPGARGYQPLEPCPHPQGHGDERCLPAELSMFILDAGRLASEINEGEHSAYPSTWRTYLVERFMTFSEADSRRDQLAALVALAGEAVNAAQAVLDEIETEDMPF